MAIGKREQQRILFKNKVRNHLITETLKLMSQTPDKRILDVDNYQLAYLLQKSTLTIRNYCYDLSKDHDFILEVTMTKTRIFKPDFEEYLKTLNDEDGE